MRTADFAHSGMPGGIVGCDERAAMLEFQLGVSGHAVVDQGVEAPAFAQARVHWRGYIDGLRAVAVLAVLLYHVGLAWLPGGFVGVDVFFVISGFLISRVIYDDIAASGRFHIGSFYERRIRRIVPAFVAVTAATLAAGYFLFLPDEFARLGKSVIYAAAFSANIFFYLTSNYFGPAADAEPLLHYWSLGVEEQFYVVFPLVVLACSRFAPRLLAPIIFAVAAGSLALAQFYVRTAPAAAFYLAPERAWELMAGSMLALPQFPFPRRRLLRETAAAVGLGLILFAVLAYDTTTPFPGLTATLPVGGCALILWGCDRGATLTGHLLSLRPLRWIGLWSYSIYMIHWPLIVFGRQLWPDAGAPLIGAIIAVSVALGAISYWLIETPFRKPREVFPRPRTLAFAAGTAIAGLAGVALFVYASDGFAARLPSKVRTILAFEDFDRVAASWRADHCLVGDGLSWDDLDKAFCLRRGHPSALLWGDSHAAHLYAPLSKRFAKHGIALSQANATGCAPIIGYSIAAHPGCQAFNDNTLAWIKHNRPDVIVLSALWPMDPRSMEKAYGTIDRLVALGAQVVIVGATPRYAESVPHILARRLLDGDASTVAEWHVGGETDASFGKRFAGNQHVLYISPRATLCTNSKCPLAGDDGLPLLWDKDHFTEEGAEFAVHRMFDNAAVERVIFGAPAE